jgi:hypothetical protein
VVLKHLLGFISSSRRRRDGNGRHPGSGFPDRATRADVIGVERESRLPGAGPNRVRRTGLLRVGRRRQLLRGRVDYPTSGCWQASHAGYAIVRKAPCPVTSA